MNKRIKRIVETIEKGEIVREDSAGIGLVYWEINCSRIYLEWEFEFDEKAFKESGYTLGRVKPSLSEIYFIESYSDTIELVTDNWLIRPMREGDTDKTTIIYERKKEDTRHDYIVDINGEEVNPIQFCIMQKGIEWGEYESEIGFVCELPLK